MASASPHDGPVPPGPESGHAFGMFRNDLVAKRMTWTDELFSIFGFEVGQVVPTFSLMVSHVHRTERPAFLQAFSAIARSGIPFSRWHRIIDAKGHLRQLLTNVTGESTADGEVVAVRGWIMDLTTRVRDNLAPEIDEAVARSAETRAVIDEAKGILMAALDIDDTQAFELLKRQSSHANRKLRDVAQALCQRFPDPRLRRLAPKDRVTAIFTALATPAGRNQPPRGQSFVSAPRLPSVPGRVPGIAADQLPGTMLHAVAVSSQSITISDVRLPDAPLVYVNKAFEVLTGYPPAQTMGRNCRFLQGPDTTDAMTAEIRAAMAAQHEVRTVLRNFRKDGSPFWNELHLSPVHDSEGRLTHYIGYQSDVTERVERELELASLAYTDPLTNLPNEVAAAEHLQAMTLTADPRDVITVWHVGVPRLDLTGDPVLGHAAALQQIADHLQLLVPPDAYLAKPAGDAFLVITPRSRHDDGLEGALRAPFAIGVAGLPVELQVGCASWPLDAAEAADLIDLARTAGRPAAALD